jgi:hypothetical protein
MRTHRHIDRLKAGLLGVLVLAISLIISGRAVAKDTDLGSFGVWRAYAYEEGGQNVCYMVTTKEIKAKGKQPRIRYLMVTHRPVEGSADVFSYGAGVALDTKHGVTARLGKDSYDLFSARDTAWARDAMTDHKIAAAIRKNSEAHIVSIPSQSRASSLSDRFSLTGAHQAYNAINRACGIPEVGGKATSAKKQPVKATPSAVKTQQKKVPKKTVKTAVKSSKAKTAASGKAVFSPKKEVVTKPSGKVKKKSPAAKTKAAPSKKVGASSATRQAR